ncbi:MAG: hypothetical protein K2Y14_01065 [Burkholderiales bacterium]|nr:hypothetical protein [Burkholderiales bacterium]
MKSKDSLIWLPVIYLAMIAILFAVSMPMPQDDLLRDIVAGDYGYNYANLYAFAPFMAKYNQYIAFDIFLHDLNQLVSKTIVAHIIQTMCYLLFIAPCLLIFMRTLKLSKDKYVWLTLLLIVLLNNFTMSRLVLARPEMIFTCWITWGLLAKIVNRNHYKFLWIVIGFCLIPTYWLAFFYTPAIFFIMNKKVNKIIISLMFVGANLLFWQYYSHNQWIHSFLDLPHLYHNRLAVVGENKSILIWFLTPITSISSVLYGYSYRHQINNILNELFVNRNYKIIKLKNINLKWIFNNSLTFTCAMLMLCFALLNMIRYSALISVLFCILLAIRIQKEIGPLPGYIKYITLCLAIFVPLNVDCYRTIPKFNLPANSVVLGTNQSNYYVPFYSPKIKIAPAMEIGANTKDVQLMMKSIDIEGTVSCAALQKYKFDFVVERNLTSIPSCLKIYQVQHGWRAWKVIYD